MHSALQLSLNIVYSIYFWMTWEKIFIDKSGLVFVGGQLCMWVCVNLSGCVYSAAHLVLHSLSVSRSQNRCQCELNTPDWIGQMKEKRQFTHTHTYTSKHLSRITVSFLLCSVQTIQYSVQEISCTALFNSSMWKYRLWVRQDCCIVIALCHCTRELNLSFCRVCIVSVQPLLHPSNSLTTIFSRKAQSGRGNETFSPVMSGFCGS